ALEPERAAHRDPGGAPPSHPRPAARVHRGAARAPGRLGALDPAAGAAVRAVGLLALPQAPNHGGGAGRPTPAPPRNAMATPSTDEVRGQLDGVGYARTPEAMAKVWELAAKAPPPLGPLPAPGVVGAIGPHDDYVYAARVDRELYPLVTAKTVVLVGA